jgi:2-phosphoxylose phosphatase
VFNSSINPFVPSGWIGSCQFPQITSGGLDDSWVHGADLYGVYHDLLAFLPDRTSDWQNKVKFRVTNNQITSQVAGMLIAGMRGSASQNIPLLVQASTIDSLEPTYTCTTGSDLFNSIKSSDNPVWTDHLARAADLYEALDAVSGVSPSDSGFHSWFDHYYDNLSARQCHNKPLPCNETTGECITQEQVSDECHDTSKSATLERFMGIAFGFQIVAEGANLCRSSRPILYTGWASGNTVRSIAMPKTLWPPVSARTGSG